MEFVMAYVAAHPPLFKMILIIIGTRAIFKPLCMGIQAYVDASESTSDNVLWDKIKSNPVFKGFSFFLDYIFSLKFPVKKEDKQ